MTDLRDGQGRWVKPLWFGPEDRPLFGWVHAPGSGQVRGAVVLAPTLGIEAVNARYAFKDLADALADAGFAALRFDYDGTGDSAGRLDDPGRVEAWSHSLRTAIELARGLGLGWVSVVGLRIGATLAAEVLGSGPASIDDLVLWDPCASGRTFLREQGALGSIALGAEKVSDGSIETPGMLYSADTVSELSTRTIASGDGPLADRILVLIRSGRAGDRRMNERLDVEHAERMSIKGQEELIDAEPEEAKVPGETVATIVAWLAANGPTATVALDVDAVGREFASIEVGPGGVRVEERAVRIGPAGLFGIETSPPQSGYDGSAGPADSPGPSETPTVLFLNAGVIDHLGPARLWVELGRQWAAAAIRSVRFDISGVGDSPPCEGQPSREILSSQGADDVADVVKAVWPADPSNVVLVGLCSGAYYAMEKAAVSKVRGVCAINPPATFKLPDGDESAASGQVTGDMKGWVSYLRDNERVRQIVDRLPTSAWWVINRVTVKNPPVRTLRKVVDSGTTLLLIVGPREGRWMVGGEGRMVRKLERTARFRMETIPDLEHTLLERRTREIAAGMLTEHVIRNFGPPPTAPETKSVQLANAGPLAGNQR